MKKLALSLLLTILLAPAAHAAPKMLKQHGNWGVYSYSAEGGGQNCYLLTIPKALEPASVDHGSNFFLISPAGANRGFEPQARMGYPLKPGVPVNVTIGESTFRMVTKDDRAWMRNEARGPEMIQAMRRGSDMTVEATSQRGTGTRYVYSLSGVTAALNDLGTCQG